MLNSCEVKKQTVTNLTVDLHCVFCPHTVKIQLLETDPLAPLPHHFLSTHVIHNLDGDVFLISELETNLFKFSVDDLGIKRYEFEYDEQGPNYAIVPQLLLEENLIFYICQHCDRTITQNSSRPYTNYLKSIYNELLYKNRLHIEWNNRRAV